jgi:hypothetical protein
MTVDFPFNSLEKSIRFTHAVPADFAEEAVFRESTGYVRLSVAGPVALPAVEDKLCSGIDVSWMDCLVTFT